MHRLVLLVLAVVASLLIPASPTRATEPTTSPPKVLAVAAGGDHTCAIRTDGTLVCWGGSDDPWEDPAPGPEAVPPVGTFTAVSAAYNYTCAIRTDGTLACWGDNTWGQTTPPDGTFTAVDATGDHACAIRDDDTLACWGQNLDVQASPPAGTFKAVSAGSYNCGIRTDGTLACWGLYGVASPLSGTFTAVSVGAYHACAVRTDETLACWGYNGEGQAEPPAGTFTALSSGALHTCAIRTDGTLDCWGDDQFGQATPPAGTFTAVSGGGNHTCAIRTDGTFDCWGDGENGQLAPPPLTAFMTALPAWTTLTAVPLQWTATLGFAPVASYEVRYRRAPWNGGFGSQTTWLSATTATSGTFDVSPGYTYCFSVRAQDADGGVSPWSTETCTAIPLDDRALSRSGSWTAGTGAAYYRSTYLRASSYGAKLTRAGVVARRIALLATTCATCGSVKVYWGSTLLKTVSLYSATTVNKKLISVKTFTSAHTGTLTIKVASSGRKVIIDGVAIRRN